MALTFNAAKAGYGNLWRKAVVDPKRVGEAERVARRIIDDRERYEATAAKIGHPKLWPLIGAIHDREASGSFAGVLHNGEKIIGTGRLTRLKPVGRGPFNSWEEAADDALRIKGWHTINEWPIERWLYEAERYNGWGYVNKGVNSPYVWAGTSQQQRGKYVADGKYSASAWDTQLGVAAILKEIFELEPSATPKSDTPPLPPADDPPKVSDGECLAAVIKAVLPLIEKNYVLLTHEQFAQLVSIIRSKQ